VPEIAKLLGITRQGIYRMLQRETTFLPPAAEPAAGRV
jgi:predicted DNA-binding transcriptional regulator AlpA